MKTRGLYLDNLNMEYNKSFDVVPLFEELAVCDEYRAEEIRDMIVVNNTPLIHHLLKKFNLRLLSVQSRITPDEIFSAGLLGLAKAINTFKLDKGYKFSSYASRCILNEVFIVLRFNKRYQKDVSMDRPVNNSYNDETLGDLLDLLGHPTNNPIEDALYELIGSDLIEEMKKQLNPLQIKVLDCILADKHESQRLMAEDIGISRSYVSMMTRQIQDLGKELYTTH